VSDQTKSPPHDVNGENAALMTRQQIIDEIADDRVRFVPELCHHATNQSSTAAMPFQVDRAVKIACAVDLGPAMRASGLFGPNFDEPKFPLQLRVVHDLVPQRFPTARDDLNHRLHSRLDSAGNRFLCNVCLESGCSLRCMSDVADAF
jgi:hypothetical protein